jgi:hypothetical protein
MLDLLWKRNSQAGLRMLFHNISPLGEPSATLCFFPRIPAQSRAICAAEWAMGFHNPMQARLRRDLKIHRSLACPSTALRFSAFSFIRAHPSHPWLKIDSLLSAVIPKMILVSMILPEKIVEGSGSKAS